MRLIDADAVIENLFANLKDGEVLYRIPLSAIMEAPTVEPTQAYWVMNETYGSAMCSWCAKVFRNVYDGFVYDSYCRHCGSKMTALV